MGGWFMGGEWGCRVLPKLKELALTRKADGGLCKGQRPSTPRQWHWAMGGQREKSYRGDGSSPWGGNVCLRHLDSPSLGRKTVLGKDLSAPPLS